MSFLKESINLLEMKSNDDTDIVEYFNKINNYYSR